MIAAGCLSLAWRTTRRASQDLAAISFMCATVCLWLYPATLRGQYALIDDTLAQHYPFLGYLVARIGEGRLPTWSPEIFMGYPLASSVESQLFSPANWPFIFFETHVAITVKFVTAFCAAAVFAYFLARHFCTGRWGSVLTGLVWSLGNHALVSLIEPYALTTMMWFPLVLLAWDKGCRGDRFGRWFPLAGLFLGLALLGGHMQHAYNFGLFLAAFTMLVHLGPSPRTTFRRRCLRCTAGAGVALGIAGGVFGVNLVPSIQTESESVRARMAPKDRFLGSLEIHRASAVLFPRVTGADTDDGLTDYASVGLLPVFLATIACGRRRSWENRILALSVGFLGLAVGDGFWLSERVLTHLPGYDFKEPHRIALVFSFGIAVLSGRGLDRLVRRSREGCSLPRLVCGRALGLGFLGILALRFQPSDAFRVGPWEILLAAAPMIVVLAWVLLPEQRTVIRNGAFALALVVGCVVWSRIRSRQFFRDLRQAGVDISEPSLGAASPNRALLPGYLQWLPHDDQNGPVRVLVLPPLAWLETNFPLLSHHQTPSGYLTLFPARLMRLFSCDRDQSVFAYERRDAFDFVGNSGLLDLLNVGYVVARDLPTLSRLLGPAVSGPGMSVSSTGGYFIATNLDHLPRSFFIDRTFFATSAEAAISHLLAANFNPRLEVVIEGEPDPTPKAVPRAHESLFSAGTIVSYEPERVVVALNVNTSGWLVLMDRYAEGWSCMVNAQPVPIRRANFVARAVRVPSGRSVITFTFSDNAFRVGAALTMTTLAVVISALACELFAHKRRLGSSATLGVSERIASKS